MGVAAGPATCAGAVDLLRAQPVTDLLQGGGILDSGESVVQFLEADPGLGGLPLGPVVAVDAQLGVVGEVAGELQEERPEGGVCAVEVPLVDDAGAPGDPRIRLPFTVAAPLGPEHLVLLLRAADEHHPFLRGERRQALVHHIVLALPPSKIHHRDLVITGEPADRGCERIADRGQRSCRGHLAAKLAAQIAHQCKFGLQRRHVDVEIHPVDALNLEHHMIRQDVSDGAR